VSRDLLFEIGIEELVPKLKAITDARSAPCGVDVSSGVDENTSAGRARAPRAPGSPPRPPRERIANAVGAPPIFGLLGTVAALEGEPNQAGAVPASARSAAPATTSLAERIEHRPVKGLGSFATAPVMRRNGSSGQPRKRGQEGVS